MATDAEMALTASDLRVVIGQLIRRLRGELRFPLLHGAVLGRLDREGPRSVSDLAAAERVRPQSMAQTVGELEADGLVGRSPDPTDGRRAMVAMTEAGRATLEADRGRRVGWLVSAIAELPPGDQEILRRATPLLKRLAES